MGGPKQKGITQYGTLRVFHSLLTKTCSNRILIRISVSLVLSPYRQKALKGMFSGYLVHGFLRISRQAPYFLPPFAIGSYLFFILFRTSAFACCIGYNTHLCASALPITFWVTLNADEF